MSTTTNRATLAALRGGERLSIAVPAWRSVVPALPVVAALLLWALSLQDVELARMTDLGLVSVLPVSVYAAVAILTVSFCVLLYRRETHWLLPAIHVVALIVIVHGTPAILYETLRYSWAWKHVGIVDYIQRHGAVDPSISTLEAYHNWPGFFALAALVTEIAGYKSALSFASWAPVFFNALFAAAVLFVFRALTADWRLSWFGAWVFCVANWVGQDYFSPQATTYFLYLVVLGACLRWFRPLAAPPRERIRRWVPSARLARALHRIAVRGAVDRLPSLAGRARQRPAVLGIVIALSAVIVVSHQLTPLMLIAALAAIVALQVCTARGLPVLLAVLMATWVTYMAVGFLKGNLYWIVDSIGKLNIGSSTLANLTYASEGHVFVAWVARVLTGVVGVLAVAGFVRRLRAGSLDLPAVLLALSPLLMVWGNAYGGEVLFRVYFFALPFLAFFAAALLFPSPTSGRSLRTPLLAAGISAALLAGLYVAYYGNERMYRFTKDEVRAAKQLYGGAPANSIFVSGTQNYPWAFRDYERYRYVFLADEPASVRRRLSMDPVGVIEALVRREGGRSAYVILTRSQKAEVEMSGVMYRGTLERVERGFARSPRARRVYDGPDAQVFALAGSGPVR